MNRKALGVLVAIGMVIVGFAKVDSVQLQAQSRSEHCVAQGDTFNSKGELIKLGDGIVTCYETIAEALFAASGGSVNLPTDTESRDITRTLVEQNTDLSSDSSSMSNNVLLATYWENASQGRSSISIWMSQQCGWLFHFGYSVMPSGWDNRVSSTQSYGECGFNELSENNHHSGAKKNCGQTGCIGTIGLLDNQTSSTYLAP